MTELEFEKACRGNVAAYPGLYEYAWGYGLYSFTKATSLSGTEDGTETVTDAGANCCCDLSTESFSGGDEGQGPLRCGIFAQPGTLRHESGASYWGIMELSGNLFERCVTIADQDKNGVTTNAGLFDGSHGDGSLSADGYATNATWPGYSGGEVTGALGAGLRGGSWNQSYIFMLVSDRVGAADTYDMRDPTCGFRAIRSLP